MSTNTRQHRQINWRSVALPAEHGAWSLLIEPIALGLLLAPTGHGLLFALTIFALFLIHQPLKIVSKNIQKGKFTERTRLALIFLIIYLIIAIIFGLPLLTQMSNHLVGILLACGAIASIQFYEDFNNRSRSLIAEISGAIALSGIVSCIVLLADWTILLALMLWLIVAIRAVTAILFVRHFFRHQRQQPASIPFVYIVHVLAIVIIAVLAFMSWIPYLTIVPFVILLGRVVWTVKQTKPIKPQAIGIREVIYGVLLVLFVVLGFSLTL